MDIGGSHATAARIDAATGQALPGTLHRMVVDPQGDYGTLVGDWTNLLRTALARTDSATVAGLAVAMPGPFDYETGVSKLTGLAKFDRLFGANLRTAFGQVLPNRPITFLNDAQAFALGCAARYPAESVVVLTLGTGFGAAFIRNGWLCTTEADNVPAGGHLYNQPYGDSIIEELISARALLRHFFERTGRTVGSVAELVSDGDRVVVRQVFTQFGEQLGHFLTPYLTRFGADRLIIGGGIARAHGWFGEALSSQLPSHFPVNVEPQTDRLNMAGAVQYARRRQSTPAVPYRKTRQYLMPARKLNAPDVYDIYPTFQLVDDAIFIGYDGLADFVEQHRTVVLDGYVGVLWEPLIEALNVLLQQRGRNAEFRDVRAALKPESEIKTLTEPYLGGNDPLFGRLCPLDLADFFDPDKLARLQPDAPGDLRILYGPGSALANPDARLVYVDLPKNELQFRSRAGSVTNLGQAWPSQPWPGAAEPASAKAMYKRFYFVDWPVLNRHKKALLPRVALFMDGQRPDEPTGISGTVWREGLHQLTRNAFRVRPWFEPGAWGGQWMKTYIVGLNPDEVNYAWSFELIVPENGLIFQSGDALLECSFDWLMYADNRAVLGEAADRFGDEFPIRFDFLDTVAGGNLSVQCHPRTAYIREQFGEPFTQDETYYILDCTPDATVYVGFQAGVQPDDFAAALQQSAATGALIHVPDYVQVFPAHKHDLFLIPNGTIHCAGRGNLVLEISATPYIYTFKLYDWLRLDLDGNPRPLNLDRGLANLNYDRQGDYVAQHLISKPTVIREELTGRVVHLPTHPEHFYDVHRLEFADAMTVPTNGQCHVLSVVEGQSVAVTTGAGEQVFHFAETFVIPAAVTTYRLRNLGPSPVRVINAFVKPSALSPT